MGISILKIITKIKDKIVPTTKSSEVMHGESINDLVSKYKINHSVAINTLINYAHYTDMPVEEFASKLKDINKKQKKYLRNRVRDIIHSAKNKFYDVVHTLRDKYELSDGYIYEAKTEACPICKKKHGMEWDTWKEIHFSDRPLIHPNCNCVILDYNKDFNDLSKKDWLNMQTKEVKKVILSKSSITINKFKSFFGI